MKLSKKLWISVLAVLLILCICIACLLPWNRDSEDKIHISLWIDPINGSDANDGTTEATALKTLSAAKVKAAALSETGDVVVGLKGGVYAEGQTIAFGQDDSGKNDHTITYMSVPGETAIISGGTQLNNWTLHDPLHNIYVTDVPEGAELARQFYVDGEPMPNAATEYSPSDWQWLNSVGYMSPYVDSADSNEYLILDLGEEQLISQLTLYSGSRTDADGKAAGFPRDFTVSASVDGKNWTVLAEQADCSAPETRAPVTISFEAKNARYVKINITKLGTSEASRTGKYNVSLTEIAVSFVNSNGASEENSSSSETSQSEIDFCKIVGITAKNDNAENRYAANKAIDGFIEPASGYGWLVPEGFGLENIQNPGELEIHTLALWYHTFELATGISADGTEIYANTHDWYPTWLANAYAFIDTVGEWYMDRTEGKLYYKANGTMDEKEAILPVVEQIICMEGASNIIFDGITFEHSSYLLPSQIGYIDAQANTQVYEDSWKQVDGGIMLDSCEYITITNCVIRNMGTAGIKVRSTATHSDDITITNNKIYDISYNGITIGEVYQHSSYEKWQLVTDTVIRNNYITRVGLDIFDSCGITATYTSGTVIDHNEIAYCPYSGISTGWGWCNDNEDAAADVGKLQITNNYIHDTGKVSRDGGSIYNLGSSTGTVISGNYVCNSWDGKSTREQGIYLDEGSSNIEVYGNVVGENVRCWMYQWQASIKNNCWHDNFYDIKASGYDKGTDTKLENNTAVEDAHFSDFAEAQKIIDNAGLLDKSLKDGIENGFAPEHQILQKILKDNTCRYISAAWGWQNVQIAEQIGRTVYDRVAHEITIVVPEGTDVRALALTYETEAGFACDKASGSVQDFSQPVTYTISKSSQTIVWTVIVKVAPEAYE